MKITSSDFQEGGMIPIKFSGEGGNLRPNIQIQDPPEATKSLAIIMDDPDAPSATFLHWTIWNISPDIKEITSDALPKGAVEGANGRGEVGYTGPFPPTGTHRYIFHLFALDRMLDLPRGSSKDDLEAEITDKILSKAELIGLYTKKTD